MIKSLTIVGQERIREGLQSGQASQYERADLSIINYLKRTYLHLLVRPLTTVPVCNVETLAELSSFSDTVTQRMGGTKILIHLIGRVMK